MGTVTKRVCQYGAKCYRKNQNHFKEFLHPSGMTDVEGKEKVTETSDAGCGSVKKDKINGKTQGEILKHIRNTGHTRTRDETKLRRGEKRKSPIPEREIERGKNSKTGMNPTHYKKKLRVNNNAGKKTLEETKEISEDCTEEPKCLDDSDNECESGDVKSNSWTYIKTSAKPKEPESTENDAKEISKEEFIKSYYLVEMPADFYSFFQFCESNDPNEPLKVLEPFGLTLVGPYDILAGKLGIDVDKNLILCHWRYYYDPPEFQTVLASESGFHIGYWRDAPEDKLPIVASNNACKGCTFEVRGENIFAAIHHYLAEFAKKCEPFSKMKAEKFLASLDKWAENNKYSLEKITQRIKMRQKNVNSKTFHGMGIVVPVEKKTEVGYRPLIETDVNLKKICKLIMATDNASEREILMDRLQPLITAANIANDECDFGNSLELGIDLFCMGSPLFHDMIEHLLTTAYSLLNRSEYGEIIKVHLKNRRKSKNLSIV